MSKIRGLLILLWERRYGKGRFNVEFTDIECLKSDFSDTTEVKTYASAIHSAEELRKEGWFLTEKNILVCGHIPGLDPLNVSIDVERNFPFLLSQYGNEIQEGYVIPTTIEGLDLPKGEVVGPRPGFWAVFSEVPG